MVIGAGLSAETLSPLALSVLRGAQAQMGEAYDEAETLRVASACFRLPPTNGKPMTDVAAVAEALWYSRKIGGVSAWALGMVACDEKQQARAQAVWTMMGEAPLWSSDYDEEEGAE